MIEDLKYQQDQQALHNQISNLEVLKAQQVTHFHPFYKKNHQSIFS